MKLNKDVLTTKIQKVKKWTKAPSKKAKTAKQIRMSILVANIGDVFYDEFSAQKQNVLDEIIYKSVEAGIFTVHVDTLCKNVIKVETGKRGIGKTTVKATVKLLRLYAAKEFYIGQIGNGNAGAYVFVDLRHPKATEIMANLFGVMVARTGIDNTTSESHNDHSDDQNDGLQQTDENDTNESGQNTVTPMSDEDLSNDEKQPKTKSLSFSSFSHFFKDLKPKHEGPINLYGKVCKLLKVVGKNSLVTKLVRMCEKAKNEIINFTDDHFMYALQESVNYDANDLAAYTASIIYNTGKQNDNSYSKPVKQVDESKLPSWYKDGKHKQHENPESLNNDPSLEAERQKLLARLGY